MSIDKEIERLKEIIENDKKDKENAKAIIERIKNKFYGYSNEKTININDIFDDKRLIDIILNSIHKDINDDIFISDLLKIKILDCKGKDIYSLKGIENLENLEKLIAGNNEYIEDIKYIKDLKKLTHLKLAKTSIKDIEPISELTNLIEISLYDCILDSTQKLNFDKIIINNQKLKEFKFEKQTLHQTKIKNYRKSLINQ